MPSALLLPLLTCSAVLLLSGVGKLRDPAGVDAAFGSMRVPAPLDAAWARRALPWGEVALGLWLLLATGVALVLVAVAVLALFLAYLVLVTRALRAPAPADCGCFGAIGDSRVTPVTVWRNGLLVLAATLTVVAGLRDVSVLSDARLEGVWAWLIAAFLAVAVAVLVAWRPAAAHAGEASGPGRAAGTGPAPGTTGPDGEYLRTPIPRAQVLTESGEVVLVGQAASRAAHLLVFLSPGCGPCQSIGPDLAGWRSDLQPVVLKAVVTSSPDVVHALPYLAGGWFDVHGITREAFGISTPGAVLLGADGALAGGPVMGEAAVREFVAEVSEHLRQAREEADGGPADDAPAGDEPVRPPGRLEPVSDDR